MPVNPVKITLGTMRLGEITRSISDWVVFFENAYDLGVRTIHVSDEYDSWPLWLDIAAAYRLAVPAKPFRYIAKLGEPHFDKPRFSASRLQAAVDAYRGALSIDCLDDVQWMWRADLKEEVQRLSHFAQDATVIEEATRSLKSSGAIGRLLCFPYTLSFADAALAQSWCDGLVVYRNAQERDYDVALDTWHAAGRMAHIIRPFMAGETLGIGHASPRDQLTVSLDHPAIETAILSTARIDHLQSLLP